MNKIKVGFCFCRLPERYLKLQCFMIVLADSYNGQESTTIQVVQYEHTGFIRRGCHSTSCLFHFPDTVKGLAKDVSFSKCASGSHQTSHKHFRKNRYFHLGTVEAKEVCVNLQKSNHQLNLLRRKQL